MAKQLEEAKGLAEDAFSVALTTRRDGHSHVQAVEEKARARAESIKESLAAKLARLDPSDTDYQFAVKTITGIAERQLAAIDQAIETAQGEANRMTSSAIEEAHAAELAVLDAEDAKEDPPAEPESRDT